MWKWLFTKVIKMREKVALDLGQEDEEKPFLEHLEDLRLMLIRMALTLCGFVLGTFIFYHFLWDVVTYPIHLAGLDGKIIFQELNPIGGFMAIMNLSIVGGIVISSPLLIYFLMQFILPGLRHTEKKVLWPALAVGGGLFFAGASFAFFIVVPKALDFFFHFNISLSTVAGSPPPTTIQWGISQYVKFVCQFILIFGLCFELPVVVMALVKLDILSYKVMKGSRSWAMIGITVVSAILAPSPDPMTLLLIAGPLYFLYEICIWLSLWLEHKDRKNFPEYYKEREEDEKALEASDEWDNENYNPWNDDSADDEEKPAPRAAPAGTVPVSTDLSTAPAEPPAAPDEAKPSEAHADEPAPIAPPSPEPASSPEVTPEPESPKVDPDHPHPPPPDHPPHP